MKTLLTSIALFLSLASASFAQAKTIDVHVNGMVCAFCGQGITKKFSARPEIKTVQVNLTEKTVKLELNDGKDIPNEDIETILKDSGFNVAKVERK